MPMGTCRYVAFALTFILPAATLAIPGSILKVGAIGGNASYAVGINEHGQVIGYGTNASGNALHILYHDGTPSGSSQDLGLMPGSTSSAGTAINDNGDYLGSHYSSSIYRSFIYGSATATFEDLGSFAANVQTYAFDLNDSRQTVGSSYSGSNQHAFLRSAAPNSPLQDLGTLVGPDGDFSEARQINNAGTIVGTSRAVIPSGMGMHAFVYTVAGGMQDLGALPGGYLSYANAISENGIIVGESTIDGVNNPPTHAFRLNTIGGAKKDLGVLGGNFSSATGVNDSGMVIGSSTTSNGSQEVPTLWTPAGTPVNLNVWLDSVNPTEGAHWTLQRVLGINNAGFIVGEGNYTSGTETGTRGFVIDASSLLPEPASLTAALFALAGISRRRR